MKVYRSIVALVGMLCLCANTRDDGHSQAERLGYVNMTFHTVVFNHESVDLDDSHQSGKDWYIWNFFRGPEPKRNVIINRDGSVSVLGEKGHGTLVSAAQTSKWPYFVGTAFGGGGYFEAEIAFDAKSVDTRYGWPAWWGLTLESVRGDPVSYWKGQGPNFRNTAELDIFEYDVSSITGADSYGTALHHWYGLHGSCPPKPLCDYGSPARLGNKVISQSVDWAVYHKLGALWKPATKTQSGTMTFFFDGIQMGPPISWTQFNDQPPPPSASAPWSFGILDRMHLVLVLNSGMSTPMHVRSVSVWQSTKTNNLYSTVTDR